MDDNDTLFFIDKGRFVKAWIPIIWTVFLLYMVFSKGYTSYLHPSLVWLPLSAAAILICMSAALLLTLKIPHVHDKDCLELNRPCSYKHRMRFSDIIPLLIFSVPILIVFCLPLSRGLSATMGVSVFSEDFDELFKKTFSEDKRNEIDGVPEYYISEIRSAPSKIPGKAAVIGMVYKSLKVGKPRFLLVRFYITCCAADARPLMIEVAPSEVPGFDYASLSNNEWAVCTGSVSVSGKTILFRASSISPVPKPEDEYMY
jgi:uncharacterized repeat protein (TIGR03943 family)